jgi:hypothetical protein
VEDWAWNRKRTLVLSSISLSLILLTGGHNSGSTFWVEFLYRIPTETEIEKFKDLEDHVSPVAFEKAEEGSLHSSQIPRHHHIMHHTNHTRIPLSSENSSSSHPLPPPLAEKAAYFDERMSDASGDRLQRSGSETPQELILPATPSPHLKTAYSEPVYPKLPAPDIEPPYLVPNEISIAPTPAVPVSPSEQNMTVDPSQAIMRVLGTSFI